VALHSPFDEVSVLPTTGEPFTEGTTELFGAESNGAAADVRNAESTRTIASIAWS